MQRSYTVSAITRCTVNFIPSNMAGVAAPAVPQCYQVVRETREGHIFLNLSDYNFTAEDKLFLCQQLSGELLVIMRPTKGGKVTKKLLADRHCISVDVVKSWMKKFNKGLPLCESNGHCPKKYDETLVRNCKTFLKEAEERKDAPNDEKACNDCIKREFHDFLRRRGCVGQGDFVMKRVKINHH